MPLTVFPTERLVHCPLPMPSSCRRRLPNCRCCTSSPRCCVRPATASEALVGEAHLYQPLAPLTWELALRGSRDALLPEIAGAAAYRVAPGVNLRGLALTGIARAAVDRLQRQTTNLREMAEWPGFDRVRAMRLLNALYLQGGLIVSRMHPSASSPDGWLRSRTTRI